MPFGHPRKRRAIDLLHTQSDEDRSKRISCETSRDVNDVTAVIDCDRRSSSSSSNHNNHYSLKLLDRISTPVFDHHNRHTK
ncbi:hypothetical protein Pst134EA_000534 [Puccinia striiformis f. sp. tritici]|uniref:hypothetical protein n=1 Tax=Puccinia striiformis f. sp. tritici TaxID=168172 RepID=UPI0020087446|nr:hypothetical protein Pst134EA_000534 [Puccinia striiformis f. sp. tritici]KAH9473461.1 hypothetical protein Pst134EA_000534 [Puccinia striiformis f. sp. tritici]